MTKDFWPGYWDLCAGGCIQYGETDYLNAKRELEEEYGLKDLFIEFVSTFKFDSDQNRWWGSAFIVKYPKDYEGGIKIQEEEIDEYKWVSIKDIQTDYIDNKDIDVTPDSEIAFKMLMDHYPNL